MGLCCIAQLYAAFHKIENATITSQNRKIDAPNASKIVSHQDLQYVYYQYVLTILVDQKVQLSST
jgi:ABC-type taurine transport system ATPase subunit